MDVMLDRMAQQVRNLWGEAGGIWLSGGWAMVAIAVVASGATLQVKSGARTMSLSFKDLDAYVGSRATRGGLLPRGWQKVDGLSVD